MGVKNCEEFGPILQTLAKELSNNDNLCRLLCNTTDTPLDAPCAQTKIIGNNIRIVPKITGKEEESTIVLVFKQAAHNSKNDEFSDLQLLVYVWAPLTQWNILINGKPALRPFSIISEIQKTIYKKALNGIGVITGGNFNLDTLTTETGSYCVEFHIDVFT